MDKDSIIIGFLLFFFAEISKFLYYNQIGFFARPESMKVKIEEDAGKAQKPRKIPMPAFWDMSAADLKIIARRQGLPGEVHLKADMIAALVELSR